MFQAPLSIKQVLAGVNRNYFLPAIQREFVWKEDQILNLVDSILQGYPFGSFLVWKVKGDNLNNFEFYEFIRNYHQTKKFHNDKASLNGLQSIDAILDGQQRLTSLYIAFKGTYSTKIPYRRWDDPSAFPDRKLYIDLSACSNETDDVERKYLLEFKDPAEVGSDINWFEIGKILTMQIQDVLAYVQNNKLPMISLNILSNLFKCVNDSTINYYLEESEELHKVLNIFVRVNSGGTTLSYSDLLLSIATAGFESLDARQEIHGAVDEINNLEFSINKDFVLKTCLLILDKDVRFSIDNFDVVTMRQIEKEWSKLKHSMLNAFMIASGLGMNATLLSSNYPISIIAYHIYKNNLTANDIIHKVQFKKEKEAIQKFIYICLIKQTFTGSLDTALSQTRKALAGMTTIDIKAINSQLSINKKLDFSDDDIDQLLDYEYGHRFVFMLLAFMYQNKDLNNIFHVDHIFPKSKFTHDNLVANGVDFPKVDAYIDRYNKIANLQLLEGPVNINKLDAMPEDWIKAKYSSQTDIQSYKRENYINTNITVDYDTFLDYYEDRRSRMKSELRKILTY